MAVIPVPPQAGGTPTISILFRIKKEPFLKLGNGSIILIVEFLLTIQLALGSAIPEIDD